jgi:hypothetical protein
VIVAARPSAREAGLAVWSPAILTIDEVGRSLSEDNASSAPSSTASPRRSPADLLRYVRLVRRAALTRGRRRDVTCSATPLH